MIIIQNKMKINLTDRERKSFYIWGGKWLFTVTGSTTTHPKNLIPWGYTPRITCSATNNGFETTYKNDHTEKGGVLTVDSATIGYVAFQPYNFIATDHVEKIYFPDKQISRLLGLFLKTTIDKAKSEKFWYGYKFSQERIKKQKILLPIDAKGEPDRVFMETYIQELEQNILKNAISYYEKRIFKKISLSEIWEIAVLNWKKWSEFSFENIFEKIQRGKRLTKSKHIEGDTPYVSSTSFTNGIDGFIGNKDQVRIFSHCISLANSGSIGKAFFHNYQFIGSDHITTLKTPQFEREIYLFMLPIIERLAEKYSFNREINDTRLKREKLLLPVNEQGNIDFDFMKKFIQKAEQHQLLKVYWKFRTPSHTHTHTTWIKTRNSSYGFL